MTETKAKYETKTLAVRQSLTPELWRMIESIAPAMHASRLFGVASKEQAAAIMLKGTELGLGLAASFELIQVIQGKPTLSPRGALALIQQSGELAEMKITETPAGCTVRMKRTNGVEYELTWTLDDAKRAGLVKPGGAWESYPGNMCRWRCIGFVADVVFPDILGGMKRSDEFGAVIDKAGDVVEGQWNIAPVVEAPPPAPSTVALSDLTDRFGADAVMAASLEVLGQPLPATNDDVLRVAARLAGEQ